MQYQYFAFISYNSHDQAWGKRLQRKLEHYKLPATLCSERGWNRKPMTPVFFAPTDIQPGGLDEELQQRLQASQHLIVIGSPHSAQSQWVAREIEYFHGLGREKNIHYFIVDGQPNSGNPQTECYNPVCQRLGMPEILGANIHEKVFRRPWLNRERAYAQLISKLLGLEFDSLWRRHLRQLRQKASLWTLGLLAVVAALVYTWQANQPFDTEICLTEASVHNDYLLPMSDAVVTLTLDNETKTDTLRDNEAPVTFSNIPRRYQGQPVHVAVTCRYFQPLDTVLTMEKNLTLGLQRDPAVFGDIHVRLWDPMEERTFPGAIVTVAGHTVTADEEGYITLTIPLAEQRVRYPVTATSPFLNDTLVMPIGPQGVILVENSK